MNSPESITGLLRAWRSGQRDALDRLVPLVYDELRRIAARSMRDERPDHTLQTTALIHEAYLRLLGTDVEWADRVHFYAVGAQTMRRILVDHARARGRDKRGGGGVRVPLEENIPGASRSADMLALDDAMERLSTLDNRKARAIELHYFGGLTYDEVAHVLGVSPATIDRELRLAKAWLYRELADESVT